MSAYITTTRELNDRIDDAVGEATTQTIKQVMTCFAHIFYGLDGNTVDQIGIKVINRRIKELGDVEFEWENIIHDLFKEIVETYGLPNRNPYEVHASLDAVHEVQY